MGLLCCLCGSFAPDIASSWTKQQGHEHEKSTGVDVLVLSPGAVVSSFLGPQGLVSSRAE